MASGEHFGTASLVHSMDLLGEVPRSRWWTRNYKITIPTGAPRFAVFETWDSTACSTRLIPTP
jgi:hypothetical protein